MKESRMAKVLAVLAIMGTMALLLYPLAYGPYSATHGPITVLRAMRDSLLLRISMVVAALTLVFAQLKHLCTLDRPAFVPIHSRRVEVRSSQDSLSLRC